MEGWGGGLQPALRKTRELARRTRAYIAPPMRLGPHGRAEQEAVAASARRRGERAAADPTFAPTRARTELSRVGRQWRGREKREGGEREEGGGYKRRNGEKSREVGSIRHPRAPLPRPGPTSRRQTGPCRPAPLSSLSPESESVRLTILGKGFRGAGRRGAVPSGYTHKSTHASTQAGLGREWGREGQEGLGRERGGGAVQPLE